MFKEIYSKYGDIKAMGDAMEGTPELDAIENTQGYTIDDLYAVGGAKQDAIDEHNQKLENLDLSFLGGIWGNWKYNTGTGMILNKGIRDIGEYEDPEFDVKASMKAVEPLLMSKSNQESLSSAVNKNHFAKIADDLRGYEEHKLNMEKMGLPLSLITQLLSEVGNAINYVPFLRVFGITKMTKTVDIIKASALQGTLNTAEEGVINTAYNDRTVSSYVAAFAMGAAFTGVAGGAGKVINTKTDIIMKDNADAFGTTKIVDEAEEAIVTAKHGYRPNRDYINSGPQRNAEGILDPKVEKDMTDNGFDPNNEIDIAVRNYEKAGLIPRVSAVIQEKVGLASFAQTAHRSKNPYDRFVARQLFEHGEGNYGFHKEHTASLEAGMEFNRLMGRYARKEVQAKALFGDLGQHVGIDVKEFDKIMYKYMDGGHKAVDPRLTPKMIKLMDDFKAEHFKNKKEVGEHVESSGVEEFQNGAWKEEILHRKYASEAFYDITQRAGDGGEGIKVMLEESINRAGGFKKAYDARIKEVTDLHNTKIAEMDTQIKKAQDTLAKHEHAERTAKTFVKKTNAAGRVDKALQAIQKLEDAKGKVKLKLPTISVEKLTRAIAEAHYNRMYNRDITNTADANLFSSNNQNLLMEAIKDGNIDKAHMDHIQVVLDTMGKDRKANPFEHQTLMDMSVTRSMNGEEISMMDLLDVDLGKGYAKSQKYWIGRAAMARKGDHFASEEAIHATLNRGAQMANKYGVDSKEILKNLKRNQQGVNLILGQPVDKTDTGSVTAMRVMRKLVANASLGKLGIIQAAETGRMVGAVEAAMRIPMIKDLIKGVVTGKMDTASLKGIEDYVIGDVADLPFMNHPTFGADDLEYKIGAKEKALDSLGYYLSKASGWDRMHTMQRKGMVNTLNQMWYRQIKNGTMKESQMHDLGVDDLLMADLKYNINKHSEMITGLTDKKTIVEMNFDKWEPSVRRKFGMMLHRKSTNAIQDINVGETPMWMNTEVGKFLGQFRTFSVAALGKQTTRDYKMLRKGDMEGAISMAFNTATSAMANITKIAFGASMLTGEERKTYLDRMLNPASLANQILAYTGSGGALVDAGNLLGDTLFGDTWNDIAGSTRGVGRGVTALVPALSWVDKLAKGASGVTSGLLTDKDISESSYKALYSTMPFSNNYMFEAINNTLITPTLFNE